MTPDHLADESPEAKRQRLSSLLRKYERERDYWKGSFAPHMADKFEPLIAELKEALGIVDGEVAG